MVPKLFFQIDEHDRIFPIRSCWSSNFAFFGVEDIDSMSLRDSAADSSIVRVRMREFSEINPGRSSVISQSEYPEATDQVNFLIDCGDMTRENNYLAVVHRHTRRAPILQCNRIWHVDSGDRVVLRVGDVRVDRDLFMDHFRRISGSCIDWDSPALRMWHP
jgi:hypothetical protein